MAALQISIIRNGALTFSFDGCAKYPVMPDPNPISNLDQARRYLKAIEDGEVDLVTNLFSPDATIEQLPNRIYPQGLRADVTKIAGAFEKGRKPFSRQTYEITNHLVTGDLVAMEVIWTGTLTLAFGTLAAGSQMRCHSAMFIEFRNGKIVSQRNYDCFEPW